MAVNICEALKKGIVNVSTLLIHFRPLSEMSNYKDFKYFHVCKCDKSVKRETLFFIPLKYSSQMNKLDFITQYKRHTVITQMNFDDVNYFNCIN